ncbi:hypothetical protein C8F04DRAFT_385743 [Mycena alexandri]|uniref:Uncharacterized protein n=1 Tax=Mycena alexandri TaxID=1745969 RepID=A0AAD6X748_9AGAR|nr:hypothetical protein C8F04DRAFT_385743 [Mycena alexandri]
MQVYPDWAAMTLYGVASWSHPRPLLGFFLAVRESGRNLILCGGMFSSSHFSSPFDGHEIRWRTWLSYGVFTTDCFELYRLWLQKREVKSRKIKNRDFSGVNVAALETSLSRKGLHEA